MRGLGAVLLAGVLAAPAQAADHYVRLGGSNVNPCTQAAPCATLQGAVNKAAVVAGDVIHVGPGQFGPVVTSKAVTFEGSGSGTPASFDPAVHTFVDAATTASPAVELSGGGGVRNLRARGGFGAPDTSPPAEALDLHAGAAAGPFAYDVRKVVSIGGSQGTNGRPGLLVSDADGPAKTVAASIGGDSYFTTPIGTLASGRAAIVTGTNVSAAFTGATLAAPDGGMAMQVQNRASASFTSSQTLAVLGATRGIFVTAGSELTVARSIIAAKSTGLFASATAASGPVRLTVQDSLVAVRTDLAGANALTAYGAGSGDTKAEVRNSTLVASGPNAGSAVTASSNSLSDVRVALVNTIARATDTDGTPGDVDLVADSAADTVAMVTGEHSSFSDRREVEGGTTTAPGSGTNVAGDPLFTAPAQDNYVPGVGSPVLDRANPSLFAPGALDLALGPRSLDGDNDCLALPDIGAYEGPEITPEGCVPSPDTTDPRMFVGERPVRLTKRGNLSVVVRCPKAEPDPCAGTLDLRSGGPLRLLARSKPALVDIGSAPIPATAPGASRTIVIKPDRVRRAFLRRYGKVRAHATAQLRDPAGNVGSSRVPFQVTTRPELFIGASTVRPSSKGLVRVRVRCPGAEPGACRGTLALRGPKPRRGRAPLLGSARLRALAPGRSRDVTIVLSRTGRRVLRSVRRLRCELAAKLVDPSGNTGSSRGRVTLKP